MLSFLLIASLLAASYLALMLLMTIGLFQLKRGRSAVSAGNVRVSVIVPARNEEAAIASCLNDLACQDYPKAQFEIIIADDGSTDTTLELASRTATAHPDVCIRIYSSGIEMPAVHGKKEAIRFAVYKALGELILCTDADTSIGRGWISAFAGYYEQFRPKMILGPVAFVHEETLFQKMQSVEFLSLMAATAGLCRAGLPVMCNGANLAYERQAFLDSGSYDDEPGIPSGDDLFLMSRIRKRYGAKKLGFLWDERAIVRTGAHRHFKDFWQQRLRWVSKSRGYRDAAIIFTAISTYLFNLLLLAGLLGGIFNRPLLWITVILILVKTGVEWYAVSSMAKIFGKRKMLRLFLPMQFLNILYVSVIGLLGNFLSFTWKGRNTRH